MKPALACVCGVVLLVACDRSTIAPTSRNPVAASTPSQTNSAATGILSGTVRTSDKMPVVGARVAAIDDSTGRESSASTTDGNGVYRLPNVQAVHRDAPLVSASKPGYFADLKWAALPSRLLQGSPLDFELVTFTPAITLGETVRGRVENAVCASLGYGGGDGSPCQRFVLQPTASGTLEVTFLFSVSRSFFDVDIVNPDGTIGAYSAATSSPWRITAPVVAGLPYTIRAASSVGVEFELSTRLQ